MEELLKEKEALRQANEQLRLGRMNDFEGIGSRLVSSGECVERREEMVMSDDRFEEGGEQQRKGDRGDSNRSAGFDIDDDDLIL